MYDYYTETFENSLTLTFKFETNFHPSKLTDCNIYYS